MGIYPGKNTMMQGIITIDDPKYPKLLQQINDPPKKLYYKGSWDNNIFENCLAVVGSRRMTSYGKQITEKLVSNIANRDITIVSGFMYGIDATAHKATVNVGKRTIAVMPCGIDRIYPEYQDILYAKILRNNGLIISEFGGDFQPALWTFPKRNRIVAGLSRATMIVEAGEKSGSLITAELAKKYNRKIFAVPGPLTSVLSKGTTKLIKEGANIVENANDIIKFYGFLEDSPRTVATVRGLSSGRVSANSLEQKIIKELQKEPMEADVLSRMIGTSISEIGIAISMMQLKGLISNDSGKYYVC